MAEIEKPFWFRPPYAILFDLLRLHRIRPWDVDIASLLNSFLGEMSRQKFIDFSASGTALLSSTIIHRMKSELVLKMEEPPKPPEPKPDEFVPPPLPFPLRFEFTATSVEDVLKALIETLEAEKLIQAQKKGFTMTTPQIVEHIDEFLANLEDRLEAFYERLVNLSLKKGAVTFRRLVRGTTLIEVVRTFLLVLFLANQERITVSQPEGSVDIEIQVGRRYSNLVPTNSLP